MIQTQFINWLLDTKDTSVLTLNNIGKDYFSDYEKEFEFIQQHISEYNNVPDKETFINKFPDFDLIKVTETPQYLLSELLLDKQKRMLAKAVNRVRDSYNTGDIEAAIQILQNFSETVSTGRFLQSVDLIKDTSRYDKYVERTSDFSKFYIKTGFPELDNLIYGWDKQEELATIFARTGTGKTWIMLKCASAALEQGLTVGIYSGEMGENKVGYRIDTFLSHLSNRSMNWGNADIQPRYKAYIDSLASKYKGTIKVLTPAMIDGPAGVNALKAFIEKDKLDILFIDQHSLLEDDRKGKTPVEKAANISKDLKNLQVLKKIPIIAVSQSNRTEKEENKDILDRIGQDSTTIIGLKQKDENTMTLQLVKSRDSESHKILTYAIDFDRGIFTYIPAENDALKGKDCQALKEEFENDGEEVFS